MPAICRIRLSQPVYFLTCRETISLPRLVHLSTRPSPSNSRHLKSIHKSSQFRLFHQSLQNRSLPRPKLLAPKSKVQHPKWFRDDAGSPDSPSGFFHRLFSLRRSGSPQLKPKKQLSKLDHIFRVFVMINVLLLGLHIIGGFFEQRNLRARRAWQKAERDSRAPELEGEKSSTSELQR